MVSAAVPKRGAAKLLDSLTMPVDNAISSP